MIRSFFSRVGRRGSFLLFLAVLSFVYSYALHSKSDMVVIASTLGVRSHTPIEPLWAIIWFTAGIIEFTGVFLKRDRISYVTAAVTQFAWAALWIYLWLSSESARAWVPATVWTTFALVTVTVSTWPDSAVIPTAEVRFPYSPQVPIFEGTAHEELKE